MTKKGNMSLFRSANRRERRQVPGADELLQSGHKSRDGIVPAPFQGAEYAHQPRLRPRAHVAAVAVPDLADQHGKADLAFPMVIRGRPLRVLQEGEELISVFLQPQGQAARVGVGVVPQRQIQQAPVQPLDA